jgi:hypothetical protein
MIDALLLVKDTAIEQKGTLTLQLETVFAVWK